MLHYNGNTIRYNIELEDLVYQSVNPSIDQSINPSINQSIHQSINQSIHQSIDGSLSFSDETLITVTADHSLLHLL